MIKKLYFQQRRSTPFQITLILDNPFPERVTAVAPLPGVFLPRHTIPPEGIRWHRQSRVPPEMAGPQSAHPGYLPPGTAGQCDGGVCHSVRPKEDLWCDCCAVGGALGGDGRCVPLPVLTCCKGW